MSLAARLRLDLQAAVGGVHRQLVLAEGRRTLRCELDRCDALAATVYRLALETDELAAADSPLLQRISQCLAKRVNYLLEPIAPIEVDAQGCVVQMRSSPPQVDDNGRRYYELLVSRGGALELRRFDKTPGQPRSRVPAVLTHEVVCRLADDFAAALDACLPTKGP